MSSDPIIFKKKLISVVLTICVLLQLVVLAVVFADEEVNGIIRKVDSTMQVNDPVYSLFKRKRCAMCHAVDHKLVGPPFRAIANRYRDRHQTMISVLGAKIRDGSIGSWGQIPMPPNSVTRAESELLVRWILRLANDS